MIFNGLQDVISQKMVLFVTTAVKTSNPTFHENVWKMDIDFHAFLNSTSGRGVISFVPWSL
jgi:hypothetical protein